MNLLAWVTDIPTKCIALGTWDQPGNHYINFELNFSFCFLGPAHQCPVLAFRASVRHPVIKGGHSFRRDKFVGTLKLNPASTIIGNLRV